MISHAHKRLDLALIASVSIFSFSSVTTPSPAHAQTLTPVVDVCSGIRLPRSAVTDLIGDVNQPIVGSIENTLNDVLDLPLIGGLIPDLDIDLTTILANASAGGPISVQLLDSDGNVVGPGDSCNLSADGIALVQEAGIAIGGNAVTGLGANGQAANAAELDAIAFGNNANTSAGAAGAVAIGTGASATAANSVALGAGSVADRGATAGYTAPGVTGTADSAGSVSVGAAGSLRQITNVAPGTAASDAATVGQVLGALDAVDALAGLAVQYDDGTRAAITLGGAGGTRIANLADGGVAAGSDEAVNGSQLFATNQDVAANAADIAGLDTRVAANEGDIAALQGDIGGLQTDVAGLDTRMTAAEGGIVALQGDVAVLQADVATNAADIAALGASALRYDDASHATVTLDGAGGTTIANLAPGTLAAASTEAVNGAQLFATNQALAAGTTAITNLDGRVSTVEGDIGSLDGRVTTAETDIANLDGRVTVNEGDINSLDARTTVNEGNIAVLEAEFVDIDARITLNGAAITTIDARVTTAETNLADLGTSVTGIDGRVTTSETQIAVLQQQVAMIPARFVDDADRTTPSALPTNTIALISAGGGPATLTNVAAGALSATSTDAVNGAQLYATNLQVAQNAADILTIGNNVAGSTVVAVQYSDPGAPTISNGGTVTNDVTLVGANLANAVSVHNVANGTLANDAVNLGQLQNGLSSALAEARSYVDTRIDEIGFNLAELDGDVRNLRRAAFAGTAGAMAVAAIPQAMELGRAVVGGGVGHYRGQTAFAIGESSAVNDGRAVIMIGASIDQRGKGGV